MDIEEIVRNYKKLKLADSGNLGFFAKPFRVKGDDGRDKIVKIYKGMEKKEIENIIPIHDLYVKRLREAGLSIPETEIREVKVNGKNHLVILQDALRTDEVVRNIMEGADLEGCKYLLGKILGDTIKFVLYKPNFDPKENIGFHPTLRNYAFSNDKPIYFDTFPPMLGMSQKELDRFILNFAPYPIPSVFKGFIAKKMGMVTDEYYQDDKMIIGLIGSSCRLRPEFSGELLKFSREYIVRSPLDAGLKKDIDLILTSPPRLNKIWVVVRRLLGKEGKPNI